MSSWRFNFLLNFISDSIISECGEFCQQALQVGVIQEWFESVLLAIPTMLLEVWEKSSFKDLLCMTVNSSVISLSLPRKLH